MQRPGDIFDLLFAAIFECRLDLAFDFAMNLVRDQDAAGFSETFKSCGNIDAFAIHIAAVFNDDVAKIETDPYPERVRLLRKVGLNGQCATKGGDGTGEFY